MVPGFSLSGVFLAMDLSFAPAIWAGVERGGNITGSPQDIVVEGARKIKGGN